MIMEAAEVFQASAEVGVAISGIDSWFYPKIAYTLIGSQALAIS